MKKLITSFVGIFFCCLSALTQNTLTHTIDRGETLASIAKKYGTTTEQLIQLNPNAAQFIYVGMELKVPSPTSDNRQPIDNATAINNRTLSSTNQYVNNDRNDNLSYTNTSGPDLQSFSSYGITYIADFEAIDKGIIGLGCDAFFGSNIGMSYFTGFDVNTFKTFYIGIGPAYGYAMGKTLFSVSFRFIGTLTSVQEEDDKGRSNEKQKLGWGLDLTPQVMFKLGKIHPKIGLEFPWSKGVNEIRPALVVGLGF